MAAALTRTRSFLSLFFFLLAVPAFSYDAWTQDSTTMPRADAAMNVGYCSATDTVWLVGGYIDDQSLVSFDVVSMNFTDHGQTALSTATRAYGQSYAQLNEYLYYVDKNGDSLLRFNLSTGFEDTAFATTMAGGAQAYLGAHMCIIATASGAGKLYVVGGTDSELNELRTTFVFDVDTNSWSQASDLQVARGLAGCAANSDETELFVVGGFDGTNRLNSVEAMV